MFRLLLFIIFICSIAYSQSKYSEIEKFLDCSVYIHEVKIKKEKINGEDYEIWLKNVKNGRSVPKTITSSGTGFFIYTESDYYLVTAAHIARGFFLPLVTPSR